MVTGTTENDTREAADAQESCKAPSPAPPAKALSKSGHGDRRRVTMDLDFKNEQVLFHKEEEEAPSLSDLQLSRDMQETFELWLRFRKNITNAKARSATTQDSDSSFVDSSEDNKGSDTSESKESNASHISSGDSAVVEESAVVPTLAEAIKSRDEEGVRIGERRLRIQRGRFQRDIKTVRFQAWVKMEKKREDWNRRSPEEKIQRANQVKEWRDFKAALGGSKVEEEARKHEAKEAAAKEKVKSVGKEASYNTVGALTDAKLGHQWHVGAGGGTGAGGERGTEAKEEKEMSLPQAEQ